MTKIWDDARYSLTARRSRYISGLAPSLRVRGKCADGQ